MKEIITHHTSQTDYARQEHKTHYYFIGSAVSSIYMHWEVSIFFNHNLADCRQLKGLNKLLKMKLGMRRTWGQTVSFMGHGPVMYVFLDWTSYIGR